MPLYNVHLYREMKLSFENYEADSPQQAARLASDEVSGNADEIQDCEGINLSAVVDIVGDDDFNRSVSIDFETERLRKAAPDLLEALEYAKMDLKGLLGLFGDRLEPEARTVIEGTISDADAAIANAKGKSA